MVIDVKNKVLSRIEREGVNPRGRWQFVGKECAVWCAWVGTIFLASVAVAVSFFIISHRQYALYEATHESFWPFMLEVLPYIWISIFILSGFLALYHLRHTKRGYRYPFWTIILTSIFLSLCGGLMLHLFGMSFIFDRQLGEYMPGYISQNTMEKQFWQQPVEGRLIGTYVRGSENGATVIIEDVIGDEWIMNTAELYDRDLELLRQGVPVRLLGVVPAGSETGVFHACGVFPWMYDHMVSMQDLYDDREAAIARLRQHKNRLVDKVRDVVPSNFLHTPETIAVQAKQTIVPDMAKTSTKGFAHIVGVNDPQCPHIKAVQRVGN